MWNDAFQGLVISAAVADVPPEETWCLALNEWYLRRRHSRGPLTGAALTGREKVLTGPADQSLIQMQVEIRGEHRVASGTGRFACLN